MSDASRVASLLAPNRGKYLGFVRARVGADAEDVLQLAFMRAALKANQLEDDTRAEGWFFRILRNAIADHHAHREPVTTEITEDDAAPPEIVSNACRCGVVLLEGLRSEYAEIVRRVDIEEQSLAEASRELSITPNHAAVRLHRARKALKDELVRTCGTKSMRACFDCDCDV